MNRLSANSTQRPQEMIESSTSRSLAGWWRLPTLVRMMSILLVGSLLCVAIAYSRSQPEGDTWRFADVRGGEYQLPAPADCKALVLIFLGHDCPISNSYAPELNRIRQELPAGAVARSATCVDAAPMPTYPHEQNTAHAVRNTASSLPRCSIRQLDLSAGMVGALRRAGSGRSFARARAALPWPDRRSLRRFRPPTFVAPANRLAQCDPGGAGGPQGSRRPHPRRGLRHRSPRLASKVIVMVIAAVLGARAGATIGTGEQMLQVCP